MTSTFVRAVCVVMGMQAAAMAQLAWTQVATTGPTARINHAMAYDSQRGRVVLFGGRDASNTMLADTWEWDGTTWLPQIFASGPSGRENHAMAYDSQRGKTVLFGGWAPGAGGDTWEWDGIAWTQMASSGPAARFKHAMAYDSLRRKTVLFGGWVNGAVGDTWEWDGIVWTQAVATGPSPRFEHAMAYDSQRGRIMLSGGGGFRNDTWAWDGMVWTQVASTGPSDRNELGMVHDSQRGRTVLFGGWDNVAVGDTWEWDGSNWTQMLITGPSPRFEHALAYDSQRGKTVMFGGSFANVTFLGDTWELSSSPWVASTFGSGCGSPPLDLAPNPNAPPTINTTAQASLTNMPSTLGFVALGWSRTTLGPFALPLTLAGFGLPGCDLLQSGEAATLPVAATGPGAAMFNLPIPNWTVLVGAHVYLQGWAYAPGVNAGNTIVSNGIDWGIGF